MENRKPFTTSVFIPSAWIIITVIAAYIAANFIWPETLPDKRIFGVNFAREGGFNTSLFLIIVGSGLGLLILFWLFIFTGIDKRINRNMPGKYIWLILLVLVSFGFFITGLFSPLYTSTRFYLFSDQASLFRSIILLFQQKEIYLGILIALFTVVLPLVKFIVIFITLFFITDLPGKKGFEFFTTISKWAMLDVFIVAVLLLNMKFDSRIIEMKLGVGIVWFSLSVILLMVSLALLKRIKTQHYDPGMELITESKESEDLESDK